MAARIALLRGDAAERVRPILAGTAPVRAVSPEDSQQVSAPGPAAVAATPHRVPEQPDPRVAALEARCADLELELANLRRDQESQQREAVDAAYRAGAASVVRSEEKSLALLAEAASAAMDRLDGTLARMEDGAIGLARAALEPVFGANAPLEAVTLAAIRHQLGQLRGNALVDVRLSPASGLDPVAVTRYLHGAGHTTAQAVPDPGLPAGAVALNLRLGEIQLDIARHAEEVRAVLAADAGDGAP